jgi:D-inositol-3-phosphate glycosyltransferase
VSPGRGGFRRRVEATRRVWRPGKAHLAMLPEWSDPRLRRPRIPGGFMDLPFAGSELPRERVIFRGWALFPSGPPTKVELWLGDVPLGPARLGGERRDLLRATGMLSAMVSQFEHVVNFGPWSGPLRDLTLRVVATGPEGERFELEQVTLHVAREAGAPGARRRHVRRAGRTRELDLPLERERADPASRSPRVLVFTHQLDLGGAQLYLLDLLRGMREMEGFDFTVVSPMDGLLREELERLGIPVHISTPMPLHDPGAYASRVDELAGLAARGQFDVVLLNTALAFAGADVAGRLGVPAVWSIHESYDPDTLWWMFGSSLHPEVRARAEAAVSRAAAGIFEADATRRLYEPYIGANRCVTLPYGLDLGPLRRERERFDRPAERSARHVPEDARVVLCVGTIEPRKAQVPLVQAFGLVADRHPDAELVFVGARDDEHTHLLERYVSACAPRGRVRVLPVQPDVWPWYGLSDLMVCASDVESLPRSVLEAMAWETPVLATEVFGLPDVVEPGRTGWLCVPRDVRAMADALDVALGASAAELRRMGTEARELVESRHSLVRYASAVAELLSDVAARERPAVADARAE